MGQILRKVATHAETVMAGSQPGPPANMSPLNETIQDLPLAGLIPVLLLVVAGLVLWAAGRRVLRVVFATAGLIIGFGLGWMFASNWDLGLEPWIPAAILGLALACIGALLYRVAVAVALAAVCAIAGPAAVVALGEMQGLEATAPDADAAADREDDAFADDGTAGPLLGDRDPDAPPLPFGTREIVDEANDWLLPREDDVRDEVLDRAADAGIAKLGLDDQAAQKLHDAKGYAQSLIDAVREWWASTPVRLRPAIIGAAITGGLVGLLFGTLAPSLTASVVSAFGGAMLWLGAGRVLLARLGEPVEQILPDHATWFVFLWLITSLIGVAIQWTFRPKPADNADG